MLLVYLICEINKIELNWTEMCVCVYGGGGGGGGGGGQFSGRQLFRRELSSSLFGFLKKVSYMNSLQ